jgi:hypothetical protein
MGYRAVSEAHGQVAFWPAGRVETGKELGFVDKA